MLIITKTVHKNPTIDLNYALLKLLKAKLIEFINK